MLSDKNAVGRRCTKAVAIRTPVPKCFALKRKDAGIRRRGNLMTRIGKAQAVDETKRIMKRPPTWKGRL